MTTEHCNRCAEPTRHGNTLEFAGRDAGLPARTSPPDRSRHLKRRKTSPTLRPLTFLRAYGCPSNAPTSHIETRPRETKSESRGWASAGPETRFRAVRCGQPPIPSCSRPTAFLVVFVDESLPGLSTMDTIQLAGAVA